MGRRRRRWRKEGVRHVVGVWRIIAEDLLKTASLMAKGARRCCYNWGLQRG